MKVCVQETKNGPGKYDSYILIYIDDILCIHDDPDSILTQMDKYFPLKLDLVSEPEVYLGVKLKLMQFENGVWAWGLSPSKYVQEAICNSKKYVEENLLKLYELTRLVLNPFPTDYWPELDTSPELLPKHTSNYQSLLGIYLWMIELGRIDIPIEVSMLLSHGHLETALHIMLYLSLHHNLHLCMDPAYPAIDSTQLPICG